MSTTDANHACHRKKRYWTEGFALAVKKRVEGKRAVKLRVYACPFCLGFHLARTKPAAPSVAPR